MKLLLILLFISFYFIFGIGGDTITGNFFGLMCGMMAIGIFATLKK